MFGLETMQFSDTGLQLLDEGFQFAGYTVHRNKLAMLAPPGGGHFAQHLDLERYQVGVRDIPDNHPVAQLLVAHGELGVVPWRLHKAAIEIGGLDFVKIIQQNLMQ